MKMKADSEMTIKHLVQNVLGEGYAVNIRELNPSACGYLWQVYAETKSQPVECATLLFTTARVHGILVLDRGDLAAACSDIAEELLGKMEVL